MLSTSTRVARATTGRPGGPPGCCLRFIPTHVGNAQLQTAPAPSGPVHPHARGERPGPPPETRQVGGSSPRTWGTQDAGGRGCRGLRFIPTHVGNAPVLPAALSEAAVHPHARGERRRPSLNLYLYFGSSPRTWGTLQKSHCSQPFMRFIPTHVGNAKFTPPHLTPQPVHPHARGERQVQRTAGGADRGSSPRTWGTRRDDRGTRAPRRFIPTHVGNAPTGPAVGLSSAVHPHARGERESRAVQRLAGVGSSPRTWGTRFP